MPSLDGAAAVADDAKSVCIANGTCMTHAIAFEGNTCIDDACMLCSKVFEYQQVHTFQDTDLVSNDGRQCALQVKVLSVMKAEEI